MRASIIAGVVSLMTILGSGAEEPAVYIKVEIKGTIKTGIVAIGGETTGTLITVNNVTWELDLHGDKDLMAAAEKLNGKVGTVTGMYQKKKGVEVRERHIVTVKSISAAK